MSKKADDLFGDSSSDGGDTDDLLAEAGAKKKPAATKKKGSDGGPKRLGKAAGGGGDDKKRKRDIPDADLDDSDDDNDDGGGGGAALFDSDDSDDDDGDGTKTPAKRGKLKKKSDSGGGSKKSKGGGGSDDDDDDDGGGGGGGGKKLSKREKMQALAKRRAMEKAPAGVDIGDVSSSLAADDTRRKSKGSRGGGGEKGGGYDSEDSYDSREFVRTKEDDDFIDASGEDPDALEELYREQHFDDERPSGSDSEDDEGRRKKKRGGGGRGGGGKGARKSRSRGPDSIDGVDLRGDEPPDNPIMAAVHKMKRKKKEQKKLSELEDEAREFLRKMEQAADEDEQALAERRPGLKKLKLLPEVLDMLTKQTMMRPLLEHDLLSVCRRWIQPLPNGGLGNVTLRQKLLQAVGNMTGENGVSATDLKRSGFGKVVMALYMHKSETPELKRQHKALIERWSRPIFQKSGNMRDLEKAQSMRRADAGIVGFHRAQAMATSADNGRGDGSASGAAGGRDLSSIIAQGNRTTKDSVNNRVRVPYSKGFQFSVRPTDRVGDIRDGKTRTTSVKGQREGLHKRMIEKSRPASKNQRSANISIEGRPTK